MRHLVKTSLATVVMGAVMGAALMFAGAATAGIAATKHNLGSANPVTNNSRSAGTAEICVFCHTPHGADTTAVVPLWNKDLTDPTAFTTYDDLGTSTMDGSITAVGSVSLACLSCHDGTQAMDNIINAPGSGLYDALGGGATGRLSADGWGWTNPSGGAVITSGEGALLGTVFTNIGTDLTNDHPVGVQYAGGGYSTNFQNGGNFGTTVSRDADFEAAVPYSTANRWYVESNAAVGFDKTDLMLYTRNAGAAPFANEEEPFVECASCHDPHSENATFLRISNDSSAVCLACHAK